MLLQLFHLPSNNKNNNKDNRLSVYVNDVSYGFQSFICEKLFIYTRFCI